MNGVLGHIGVAFALLSCVVALGVIVTGLATRRQSLVELGARYALFPLVGALVAVVAIERALVTHDFSLAYVVEVNSKEMPLLYSITGMWSALQGSILLWALILTSYLAWMARRFRSSLADPVVGGALVVALVVATFFFALMIGPSDPFTAISGALPADGLGGNALLQDNVLVAFHPVLLYLGFVGFTVPFAFAISSLATGRVGEGWLVATRRITIVAWAFLTIGIVLGALWSYQVLGWGGYWGWDPVENAAFLPWLTATAYLHSVLVQERRGLLRIWNLALLVATFALTILGTFLTRSGVIASVHAFSDSGIGPSLITMFAVVVVVGLGLIAWRGDRLRAPGTIDSPLSREGAFVVNNLLFTAFAFVVLLGTVMPLLVQALNGQSITIGRPYFDAFSVPIGVSLLFFMAVAPALPWRKATGEQLGRRLLVPAWSAVATVVSCVGLGIRGLTPLGVFGLGAFAGTAALRQLVLASRAATKHGLSPWHGIVGRANGGMVAHLGIVIIAVALASTSSFTHSAQFTLRADVPVSFDGHRLTLLRWIPISSSNERGEEAVIKVDGGTFRPGIASFNGSPEATATPSVDSSFTEDVYLSLSSAPATPSQQSPVVVNVFVEPLVRWLWIGGALTAFGGVLAAVPGRRRRPTDPASLAMPSLEDTRVLEVSAP